MSRGHNSLEEGCVLISRRGSYLAGGGDHTFAGQGVHFDLEGSATSTGEGHIRSNGVEQAVADGCRLCVL